METSEIILILVSVHLVLFTTSILLLIKSLKLDKKTKVINGETNFKSNWKSYGLLSAICYFILLLLVSLVISLIINKIYIS